MSNWISVKDRLPLEPDNGVSYEFIRVLATDGEWVGEYGFSRGGGHIGQPWVSWEGYSWPPSEDITHWQPLPEPPK